MKNKPLLNKREESDEAKLRRIIDETAKEMFDSNDSDIRRFTIRGGNQKLFDDAMKKEVESWSKLGKE